MPDILTTMEQTTIESVPVVWSSTTLDHVPEREIWMGVATAGTEVPDRVTSIRDHLVASGHRLVAAAVHDDAVLEQVHERAFLDHLRTVYATWVASGFVDDPGQDRVVPYVFPTEAMLGPIPAHRATAIHGRAGQFCYDTMTLVGPGTWEAARAAVDCALSAVELLSTGARAAYALCRPPGHHVTRSAYGGSCYLNNAAVAAQALIGAGHGRVAVVDVDAHHGNGTAAIFYDRADVFYGSVHIDPAAGWFPHFVGHADETGADAGAGTTLNIPLRPGTGDAEFLAGLDRVVAAVVEHGSTALVVSLGVDAAADDPESPLQVTAAGYARAGSLLMHEMGLPVVAVQEGGYHLPTLGPLVEGFLR
jgi:acetoin utilization deacetylase AcuC-like enzyme